MGYRINHYAKPTDSQAVSGWESIVKDLTLGMVSTGMCYFGFETGIVLLAFPMGLVAFMFYASVLITSIGLLRDYRADIKKQKLAPPKQAGDDEN